MSRRAGGCVHVVVVVLVVVAVDVVVGECGCYLVRCWSPHWCFCSGSRCSLGCCVMGVVAAVVVVEVCSGAI